MVEGAGGAFLEDGFEYGINLIAVDTLAPLGQYLLFNGLGGAPTLPLGPPLLRQEGRIRTQLAVAPIVFGKGLPVGAMKPVEVLDKPEFRMLLLLD